MPLIKAFAHIATHTHTYTRICIYMHKGSQSPTQGPRYPDTDTQLNVKCKQKLHDALCCCRTPTATAPAPTPATAAQCLHVCCVQIRVLCMLFTQTVQAASSTTTVCSVPGGCASCAEPRGNFVICITFWMR